MIEIVAGGSVAGGIGRRSGRRIGRRAHLRRRRHLGRRANWAIGSMASSTMPTSPARPARSCRFPEEISRIAPSCSSASATPRMPKSLRQAAGSAGRAVRRAATVATTLHTAAVDGAAQAVVEGFTLGQYRFDRHLSEPKPSKTETLDADRRRCQAQRRAPARAASSQRPCRWRGTWSTSRRPTRPPTEMARIATEMAERVGLRIEVWDENEDRGRGPRRVAGRVARIHRPSPAGGVVARTRECTGLPGHRRQGHRVRLGRPVDQARRRHGDDEDRHGRVGRRLRGDAGDRRTRTPDQGGGHRPASPRTCRAGPPSGPATCSRPATGRPSRCSTPMRRVAWCWPTASRWQPSTSPTSSSTSPR